MAKKIPTPAVLRPLRETMRELETQRQKCLARGDNSPDVNRDIAEAGLARSHDGACGQPGLHPYGLQRRGRLRGTAAAGDGGYWGNYLVDHSHLACSACALPPRSPKGTACSERASEGVGACARYALEMNG